MVRISWCDPNKNINLFYNNKKMAVNSCTWENAQNNKTKNDYKTKKITKPKNINEHLHVINTNALKCFIKMNAVAKVLLENCDKDKTPLNVLKIIASVWIAAQLALPQSPKFNASMAYHCFNQAGDKKTLQEKPSVFWHLALICLLYFWCKNFKIV